MLNAVLRKLAAEGRQLLEGQDAARLNTPKWLWDSWAAAYGEEQARDIAAGAPGRAAARSLGHARARALGRASSAPRSCRPARCAGAAAGWSTRCRATTRAPGGCRTPRPPCPPCCSGKIKGRRVLDIGAAPGGKTAQLCAMGAKVTALERSPRRAEFLVRNLGRLTLDAEIVVADALEWQAPCPVRRGPARRALHRHRHHPPPSRRALGQVAGRRRHGWPRRRRGCSRPPSSMLEARRRRWSTPSARCSPRKGRSGSRRCWPADAPDRARPDRAAPSCAASRST